MVSKAACAGLGLTVLGLLLRAGSVFLALKLLFIGGLVLVASATGGSSWAVAWCVASGGAGRRARDSRSP